MKLRKLLAAMLTATLVVGGLTGCGGASGSSTGGGTASEDAEPEEEAEEGTEGTAEEEADAEAEDEAKEEGAGADAEESEAEEADEAGSEAEERETVDGETPLVVGYSNFSSKFSPFFAETAYDQDATAMTQLGLLSSDRMGGIVYKGIEGETIPYNGTDYTYYGPADLEVTENEDGTVYYDFTLRDDIQFSDGEPLTIDDVIFSMYVRCDPTYDGAATLFSMPIEGMEEYRSGMDTLAHLLIEAGEDNTDYTHFTEAQQKAFWDAVNDGGVAFAQSIVDFCKEAGYNQEGDSVAKCAAT